MLIDCKCCLKTTRIKNRELKKSDGEFEPLMSDEKVIEEALII